jgi:hypothetical protein
LFTKRIMLAALMTVALTGAAFAGGGRRGSSGYSARSYSSRGYGTGSNPSSNRVGGHYTQRGTYVQPHYRSAPDSSTTNNWTTRGNVNPYTGRYGYRTPR